MYRFLLTRRWLGVWAALLVVVPAFILLGRWQFHRFEHRSAANGLVEANLATAPVAVEQLVPTGGDVAPGDVWRRVTATGQYDPAGQRLVRNRSYHGRPGFHVVVPLVTGSGTALLVNRGWIPAGGRAVDTPNPPPPPDGTVTVTGRLRAAQHSGGSGSGLPAGQIARIDTGRLAGELGYPLFSGYAELISEQPAPAAAPIPVEVPELSTGPHLAYAVQWWLFAIGAVVGVGYLARREAAELHQPAPNPVIAPRPPPPSPS